MVRTYTAPVVPPREFEPFQNEQNEDRCVRARIDIATRFELKDADELSGVGRLLGWPSSPNVSGHCGLLG